MMGESSRVRVPVGPRPDGAALGDAAGLPDDAEAHSAVHNLRNFRGAICKGPTANLARFEFRLYTRLLLDSVKLW